MFRRRDPIARDIQVTFGPKVARLYEQAHDVDMKVALQSALAMTKIPGINGPEMARLLSFEIYRVTTSEIEHMPPMLSTNRESEYLRVMLGTALKAEQRWLLTGSRLQNLMGRLDLVPAGWRLDAMTGLRYWIGSLIGLPAPIRAFAAELHTVAAAFAWRTAVELERSLGRPMPGLPYAVQAVALDALTEHLPDRFAHGWWQNGVEEALNGYANGLAIDAWAAMQRETATAYTLFDAMVARSVRHGVVGLRPVGIEEIDAVALHLDLELVLDFMRQQVQELGIPHLVQVADQGTDALIHQHEYVMSRLFTA